MDPSARVTAAFLAFLAAGRAVGLWLDRRNLAHVRRHRGEVPAAFRGRVSLGEHRKAADYTITKIRVSHAFGALHLLFFLGWTLGGGLAALDRWTGSWAPSPLVHGVAFLGLFALASLLLSLPASLYSTFAVEERFGFNKTTPRTFALDLLKSLAVGALVGVPLAAALLWILAELGGSWWVWAWATLALFQTLLLWAWPRLLAPLFNTFRPLPEGELKGRVEGLLARAGLSSGGLFVMNASLRSSHGNAYFTGLGGSKRVVLFDTLVEALGPGRWRPCWPTSWGTSSGGTSSSGCSGGTCAASRDSSCSASWSAGRPSSTATGWRRRPPTGPLRSSSSWGGPTRSR